MSELGRSSTNGDRYERSKAQHDRANPGVLGGHCRRGLYRPERIRQAPSIRSHGAQALPLFPLEQGAPGSVLFFVHAAPLGLFPAAPVAAARPVSRHPVVAAMAAGQPDQLCLQVPPCRRGVDDRTGQPARYPAGPGHQGVGTPRAHTRFGDERYARLAEISVSHLYCGWNSPNPKPARPTTTPWPNPSTARSSSRSWATAIFRNTTLPRSIASIPSSSIPISISTGPVTSRSIKSTPRARSANPVLTTRS